jgi:hypothetical protein
MVLSLILCVTPCSGAIGGVAAAKPRKSAESGHFTRNCLLQVRQFGAMKSEWWDDGGDNLALGRGCSLISFLIISAERGEVAIHFPFSGSFACRSDAPFVGVTA